MLSTNLKQLYFSQSALAIYEKCPLKFRRRYRDGLFWPQDWGGDLEQREVIETGKLFHRLAQRYYARGEELTAELLTVDLKDWFKRLREFRSYNQRDDFYPEQELRINRDGIKLVAKFDLLYLDKTANRFIIYDWKTNKRPFSEEDKFNNNLQSIVYLYVLTKAGNQYFPGSNLQPADISLLYWNPRFPKNIKTVDYNRRKFAEDEEFLTKKITEIKNLNYADFKAINDEKICKHCEYRPICFGKKPELIVLEEDDLDLELDWEIIEEIQF
ncbi:PD-(D/E)XK nuclease family protein [Iocasia frigidifontis]|uniref:PD-(D/E)XK nuclease family protein n=1 Tax=Iocasia fonsfrigidae TaxID=2682810 RepID=A0A8A7K7X6_9FIRM|nr:PD-(D/E)XK nuclease family protein [Iocasia fonsfrigidae]QTL97551.1 PD-(D/E)XK nuclease family protein [Iocasia fonsfrigidae]